MTSPADLPAATKLALDRTRLAYERTLMAWVRTSASMISFGFTIYKALQLLRENANVPPSSGITPREFGMGMMALGVIALTLATIQHEKSLRAITPSAGDAPMRKPTSTRSSTQLPIRSSSSTSGCTSG